MNYPGPSKFKIRNDLLPGDVGAIVYLHGTLYAREYGFDNTFEAYVAAPLSEFVLSGDSGQRIWIVEHREQVKGGLAIVRHSEGKAQLRWFLLHPELRGLGIGKRLVHQAVDFCRASGYRSVFLWTVQELAAAAAIYKSMGFRLEATRPATLWGRRLVEERYALLLAEEPRP